MLCDDFHAIGNTNNAREIQLLTLRGMNRSIFILYFLYFIISYIINRKILRFHVILNFNPNNIPFIFEQYADFDQTSRSRASFKGPSVVLKTTRDFTLEIDSIINYWIGGDGGGEAVTMELI